MKFEDGWPVAIDGQPVLWLGVDPSTVSSEVTTTEEVNMNSTSRFPATVRSNAARRQGQPSPSTPRVVAAVGIASKAERDRLIAAAVADGRLAAGSLGRVQAETWDRSLASSPDASGRLSALPKGRFSTAPTAALIPKADRDRLLDAALSDGRVMASTREAWDRHLQVSPTAPADLDRLERHPLAGAGTTEPASSVPLVDRLRGRAPRVPLGGSVAAFKPLEERARRHGLARSATEEQVRDAEIRAAQASQSTPPRQPTVLEQRAKSLGLPATANEAQVSQASRLRAEGKELPASLIAAARANPPARANATRHPTPVVRPNEPRAGAPGLDTVLRGLPTARNRASQESALGESQPRPANSAGVPSVVRKG